MEGSFLQGPCRHWSCLYTTLCTQHFFISLVPLCSCFLLFPLSHFHMLLHSHSQCLLAMAPVCDGCWINNSSGNQSVSISMHPVFSSPILTTCLYEGMNRETITIQISLVTCGVSCRSEKTISGLKGSSYKLLSSSRASSNTWMWYPCCAVNSLSYSLLWKDHTSQHKISSRAYEPWCLFSPFLAMPDSQHTPEQFSVVAVPTNDCKVILV